MPVKIDKGELTKIPLHLHEDLSKNTPQNAWLFLRSTKGSNISVTFNGTKQTESGDKEIITQFRRSAGLKAQEDIHLYIISAQVLQEDENIIGVTSTENNTEVTRIELAVGYGPPEEYGYY